MEHIEFAYCLNGPDKGTRLDREDEIVSRLKAETSSISAPTRSRVDGTTSRNGKWTCSTMASASSA